VSQPASAKNDSSPRCRSYQGSAPGPVSPGSQLRPAPTRYRWRPLRTARNRWLVDQTWTKPATLSGPVGLDQAPWSGVVGPARPGRPACGLPDDRACYRRVRILIDPRPALGGSRSMRHSSRAMSPPTTVLPRGPRGLKPPPRCSDGGHGREGAATCDSFLPVVAAGARRCRRFPMRYGSSADQLTPPP
jgi:hypothetical protein